MSNTAKFYVPWSTPIHLRAYCNGAFEQQVTVTIGSTNPTHYNFTGKGEQDAVLKDASGKAADLWVTTPSGSAVPGCPITVQMNSRKDPTSPWVASRVMKSGFEVENNWFSYVFGDDSANDNDWNDAVLAVNYYTH